MDETSHLLFAIKPERQDIPSGMGVLHRQRLLVGDSISIHDIVTGIGAPEWSKDNAPAKSDAVVVSSLMKSGCRLLGKAQNDDFGISISGQNPFLKKLNHPIKAGHRIGGSASGCAVGVASGEATVAISNNCCAGVLIPAANCHLFGYKPSRGMVDKRGMASLSPSFDSIGFMAKQLPALIQVAQMSWKVPPKPAKLKTIRYALNLFQELLPMDAMLEWEMILASLDFPREDISSFSKLILTQAHAIHSDILGYEIDQEYGTWLDHSKPNFSDETAQYLAKIRGCSFKQLVEAKKKKEIFSDIFQGFLTSGELLMIPTTPGASPNESEIDDNYIINQRQLYAIADVTGLAQLTMPLAMVNGAPMGISLLALPGEDRLLFEAASHWFMP